MKKLALLLFAGLLINVADIENLDASCKEMRDECLEECNENYKGDTTFDGIGRFACRTGCELSEGFCEVKEFIDELLE